MPAPSEPESAARNRPRGYSPRNLWKASLAFDGESVIKDYGSHPWPVRWYGRLCLHWETVALQRLAGVSGIPAFQGRPTKYSLRLGLVPGKPLATLQRGEVSRACMDRLAALFAQMHERGIAHGDAHQRNILVHEEQPYLIDFSTAYAKGRLPVLDGLVFDWLAQLDQERLYKVERKFFGTGTPPRMFFLYRAIKGLKRWIH